MWNFILTSEANQIPSVGFFLSSMFSWLFNRFVSIFFKLCIWLPQLFFVHTKKFILFIAWFVQFLRRNHFDIEKIYCENSMRIQWITLFRMFFMATRLWLMWCQIFLLFFIVYRSFLISIVCYRFLLLIVVSERRLLLDYWKFGVSDVQRT